MSPAGGRRAAGRGMPYIGKMKGLDIEYEQ